LGSHESSKPRQGGEGRGGGGQERTAKWERVYKNEEEIIPRANFQGSSSGELAERERLD
jgi:hypothetical protein